MGEWEDDEEEEERDGEIWFCVMVSLLCLCKVSFMLSRRNPKGLHDALPYGRAKGFAFQMGTSFPSTLNFRRPCYKKTML